MLSFRSAFFSISPSRGAFWIVYRISRRAFWIGCRLFRAATSSDRRGRTDDIALTTVFNIRLVFRSCQRQLRCRAAGGSDLSIRLSATPMSCCALGSELALSIGSVATPMPHCGGIGSLDRFSGDSSVMLRSWFRNRPSWLVQRWLRCCTAGGDDGVGRTGADGRSRGIDWRYPVGGSDVLPFGPRFCCDALSRSGLGVRAWWLWPGAPGVPVVLGRRRWVINY